MGMVMAFIGLNEGFAASRAPRDSVFARLRRDLAARIRGKAESDAAPRRLAGPDPRDPGARGYLADLDIEVGF